MLVIGLDRFEEIKDLNPKLNIHICKRRISLLITGEPAENTAEPDNATELSSATELESPHTKRGNNNTNPLGRR